MGFSWQIIGINGENLLEKHGINSQGLGLAPNCSADTPARHRLNDIRIAFQDMTSGEPSPEVAQYAIQVIQDMLRENLEALPDDATPTWDVKQIERFLSIDPKTVQSASGGF